ncbi:hypothetical protein C1Y26_30115 [Pseudomonas sp. MPR-R2A7]|nr:hypothetical protein C1Y23_25785 [Pseudomonas sp. GW460-12]PMX30979.1 hypothetical protein C1Y24_26865 [Pseudomonas sp. MPR-R2A4]PMX33865.1 hypothetical protein C1Y26_30115 [Pseudomonas sp. MPR-R2A7]PMX49064.1 hypothetical protein C1Y17_28265 [Pseudomonas sp. MPR-R2A6]PMX82492.1 hypothetical protein C1Y21_30960 [Pseudomonas sp. MPR-R2A3]PMY05778.1 hypothetical protein C1Y22_30645 [Pseudomonas sp. MPR-R2A5]PNA39811.1 hypothetical protein C1Y15_26665 [Pseudomonas sp. MPR-LB5]PNA66274.1 hypo
MASSVLKDGFPWAHLTPRERVESRRVRRFNEPLNDVLGGISGLAGSYQQGHVGNATTIVVGWYEEISA